MEVFLNTEKEQDLSFVPPVKFFNYITRKGPIEKQIYITKTYFFLSLNKQNRLKSAIPIGAELRGIKPM